MRRLTLAKRFLIWSLVVLVVAMAGIGLWVSHQIQEGIVHRTATTTALYVDSLIAPPLQELANQDALSGDAVTTLDGLLGDTPLGRRVSVFRVWDMDGNVIYSTDPDTVGEHLPVAGDLATAMQGKVSADIGDIEGDVLLEDGLDRHDLLEIYTPVWSNEKWKVIAVAEFYYGTDDVQGDINRAQQRSWLVVGAATLVVYLLLALFFQRSSDTIERQRRSLAEQVDRLTALLAQNDELHQRVRAAAVRTTTLNERFLRRFSAELHDGPAQDISLALLQLDHVAAAAAAAAGQANDQNATTERDLNQVEETLRHAMQEVRAISAGLMLPQLGNLTLPEVFEHAAQAHRRRTGSDVDVHLGTLTVDDSLSIKIALYRIVQEALANAWRHAGGNAQQVSAGVVDGQIRVEVSDGGPGFDAATTINGSEDHLGLLGMRERVETLGGVFRIESSPDQGTHVIVTLPIPESGEADD